MLGASRPRVAIDTHLGESPVSKRICTILAAVVASAALVGGCAGKSTLAATNTKCCCGAPVDGKTTVSYKGQTIGVCSKACADYFNKASDADKAKMAAKVTAAK